MPTCERTHTMTTYALGRPIEGHMRAVPSLADSETDNVPLGVMHGKTEHGPVEFHLASPVRDGECDVVDGF
jgi:hypothetical protein